MPALIRSLWVCFSALVLTAAAALGPPVSAAPLTSPASHVRQNFDSRWHFTLGDPANAQTPSYSHTKWRLLDVPHDWSIEWAFDAANPTGGAGGFLPAGVGWYRKSFTLPATAKSRRVAIEFDGVMANSDVWINGVHLGRRPFGYVGFRYDLTNHLRFGGTANVLAVRVDNAAQPASRWYAGAGIYRHVFLTITNPVHFEAQSTFVTTPKIAADRATVRLQSVVLNRNNAGTAPAKITVQYSLLAPNGAVVRTVETTPQSVASGKSANFVQEVAVTNPERWDIANPRLYRLRAKIRATGATLDSEEVLFGIREARFEPTTGFWLNGQNMKIKGVCLHQDAGAFGVAVPVLAWKSRLATLKQLGVNAIRTAHNPPAPEFLDLCDRMGFLVMDEMFDTWTIRKNPYDYSLYFNEWARRDTRDTVRRDRNHPSVILYSIGNEIRDTPRPEIAKPILTLLRDTCHENDPTRLVTQALFRPNVSHDYDNGLADLLDVVGQNYRENELLAAHEAKPTRRIIGTENGHDRRVWLALRDNPAYSGQFLWSGIDYLGEARRWPTVGAGSGLLDRTGRPRPLAYERQSWWSDSPMVYAVRRVAAERTTPSDPGFEPLQRPQQTFADWTPASLDTHDENVEVYSNCESVELFINNRSLGVQALPPDASPRIWKVPFESGTLRAVGTKAGKPVAEHTLRTAGKPAKIVLTPDSATLTTDWEDVSTVTATIVDADGVPVPTANDSIRFTVTGPGTLAGVDNADNTSHESFRGNSRRAFQGYCVALVRATGAGTITVTASAPGLTDGAVTIRVLPAKKKEAASQP
ncbi:MAG: glycoside hydrolase family 2 TIM barrel-domain containing protein [Armatimonadota bacterium]